MYESRLHATNGIISIAVDALNGELLEFVRESTQDNFIKCNCHPKAWSPFLLEVPDENGHFKHYCPPRYVQILDDATLKPTVTVDQREDSASIVLDYPAVMEQAEYVGKHVSQLTMNCAVVQEKDERHEIGVRVEIELPAGECRSHWKVTVLNHTDEEIQKVLFPCLNGMWIGDTWKDDQIVLPHNAGLKVANPVETLSEKPQMIYWKWQEYRYGYAMNGPTGAKDDRGSYIFERRYSGSASMLWTDLFDPNENTGIYMTCRNDKLVLKGIRAETFGLDSPGMGMSIVHFPCLLKDQTWQSETCIVALHEGDWHWGADDYRAWRESLPKPECRRHRPEWFEKSPGLVAHYDFKYQSHGVVHRYKDIPGLLEQAREMGMNHLLISGWNYDGFDHGFPQYWIDPELGTEQELIDAVRKVREMGGHLAFYINARLCNTKYEDRTEDIKHCTIMKRDGSLNIERYGAANLTFASMCNQDPKWRNEFVGVVDYLTHKIGADSMYLDQLAMAGGVLCYHPDHKEHEGNPAGWNQGYEKMLKQMRDGYDVSGMAMLYEGCSDIHGWGVSGQLISTMFDVNSGSFPELYKYTFPDQILVDMMNAKRNSGMRAEHVARKSTFLLYRAFVVGSYFWVYDLEMDNTFRRDPDQYERLKRLNGLRSAWLERYGHGRFTDVIGMAGNTEGILAKRFDLADGVLVACANEHRVPGAVAEVVWNKPGMPTVIRHTELAPNDPVTLECDIVKCEQGYKVILPMDDGAELAVFVIR